MKLAKRLLFGALSALVLAGCSEDKLGPDSPNNGNGTTDEDGVFMNVNIKMPTSGASGRSYTNGDNSSSGGEEVGQDYENNVTNVFLVLAHPKDYTFIAWGEIPASSINKNQGTDKSVLYNSVARISKAQISEYYTTYKDVNDRDVCVFVFCNPTLSLRKLLEEEENKVTHTSDWVDAYGTYDESDHIGHEVIWSENDFLMSNASIASRTLPKTIEDWDHYTDSKKPFNLSGNNVETECDNSSDAERGPVKVERAAARFDFKDVSGNENRYHVVFPDDINTEADKDANPEKCYIDVQLNKMSLTNMNKQFYYLRRVSADGLFAGADICGPEKPWYSDATGSYLTEKGNYVVNPIADKMSNPIGEAPYPDNMFYNYPFFNEEGEIDINTTNNWYTNTIDAITSNSSVDANGYHIWRYVTENTIPGVDLQKNGQSTGIVFKGKLIANEAANKEGDDLASKNLRELYRLLNEDASLDDSDNNSTINPTIYKFESANNDVQGMYASWQNVQDAAKASAITPVWVADNDHKDGGYWTLEINRSNPLFYAVYRNGSCGSYTFKDSSGKEYTVDDPVTEPNKDATNYLYEEWATAEKPGNNDPTTIAFKNAATTAGFTLYQTSKDGSEGVGYYCYYYYWNRHNDNGKNGIMGEMEFAVVRNNVYKISVSAIRNIGHPRLTINDPNKPTPDTYDEVNDVYIAVDVNVLPWVVRVNNVVF